MPRRRNEPTASSLLGAWTDADTAMHVVGTSLGVFTALDADRVLSEETPLRSALFDILLSLVEGGALEMRPADDGRYAFRWRADYATAGLDPDREEAVDVEPPSPYAAELARLRLERDDALGRAEFAEALAEERERLLRLANVPVPATRLAARSAPHGAARALDAEGQSVLDVLYAKRPPAGATEPVTNGDHATDDAAEPPAATDGTAAAAARDVVYLAPPADDDTDGPRWTGYTLEKPRPHLSTVEPLADEA
jgi:hypothetical protein